MTQPTTAERAAALEARIHQHISLARAMQVRVASFDGERLVLTAPLDANLNDKGTGFAGSLATLVTLAGWSFATLLGEACGEPCEAAVYHSELDFLRPVREELRAEAWLADAITPLANASRSESVQQQSVPSGAVEDRHRQLAELHERLRAGKRAKLAIHARLGGENNPAVVFSGNYAVWRVGTQPF